MSKKHNCGKCSKVATHEFYGTDIYPNEPEHLCSYHHSELVNTLNTVHGSFDPYLFSEKHEEGFDYLSEQELNDLEQANILMDEFNMICNRDQSIRFLLDLSGDRKQMFESYVGQPISDFMSEVFGYDTKSLN